MKNRKPILMLLALANITLASAQLTPVKKNDFKEMNNPLISEFETPYGLPPFDLIKEEYFEPSIMHSVLVNKKEIKSIANNSQKPTFENTILAMENSGKLFSKVYTIFGNLNSANTNPNLQEIANKLAPRISQHSDEIYMNDKLFKRVKEIWDNKRDLNLDAQQTKILDNLYKKFVRNGANLTPEQKEKLKNINSQLSVLSLKYGQNILEETNSYQLVIDKKEDLTGLPADLIEAAAATTTEKGKSGKWVFTLSNSSVMPFLQYSSNRELRKQIWNAYQLRANNDNKFDNKENVIQLANLRGEKARLLGYKTHADYVLEQSMAKTPQEVYKLLNNLWAPALEKAKIEANDIKKMMQKDGIKGDVMPYDWRYYAEKIRIERFNLDEQELKPYFSLDNVTKGVFLVTEKLYGLKFKELKDLPVYHNEVSLWEVKDADDTVLGLLYMDFYPRESKRGGAWMTSYREQSYQNGKRVLPIISIVCNFTKPTSTAPALFTFDETLTYFHEFGHALHGLLSDVKYESIAGTSVSRDFVELPSQVMENWGSDPEVLKMYAKHYQTGEVIPDALLQKLQNAGTFDQGFATVEYLAASFLDLDYHTQTSAITKDANSFEKESMKKIGLIGSIIPRYRSTYFSHIFAGGYSAGYYSYIWSGVLDTDAFEAFKETSLFNPEKAKLFREEILEKGGSEDPMTLYKKFRGAEPSVKALLKKRGLDKKENKSQNKVNKG